MKIDANQPKICLLLLGSDCRKSRVGDRSCSSDKCWSQKLKSNSITVGPDAPAQLWRLLQWAAGPEAVAKMSMIKWLSGWSQHLRVGVVLNMKLNMVMKYFDEDTEVDGKSALLTPRLNSRRAMFAQLEVDAGWDELDCELCGNACVVVSSAAIGIEAVLPVPTTTCSFDANTTAPCQLPSTSLLARAPCQKSLMTWCRPPSRKNMGESFWFQSGWALDEVTFLRQHHLTTTLGW